MSFEKVIFAGLIVLALTLNFGFFLGDIDNPDHHEGYELFAAIVVSIIVTIMKFGDRSTVGSILLACSLVADIQLIAASLVWAIAVNVSGTGLTPAAMSSIVSLSGGALLANLISVFIFSLDTVSNRR